MAMMVRRGTRGRRRTDQVSYREVLPAAVGLFALAALVEVLATGVADPRAAVVFGALVALGELLRLHLPGDREGAPIAVTGAFGYALLVRIGPFPARQGALQVVAVTAIAMMVGVLPRLVAGRPAGSVGMAVRLLTVACAAAVFRPLAGVAGIDGHWWFALAVMALLIAAAWLLELVVTAVVRRGTVRARFATTLRDELRVQAPLGVAVGSFAVLIVFATQVMGLVAVAVLFAPLLVTHVAFRKYAEIRATYLQTVRALARVTEIGGYVQPGHCDRVSQLAVAVGRRLGMAEPELVELRYAALMHDIGQLSLPEPIPGGGTVLVSSPQRRRIAALGAEVVREAKLLDSVAEIVRRQGDPYPGGAADASLPPLGSRIIRAAGVYDDLVGASAEPARTAAAVAHLRLGCGREYDPNVVEALAAVVADGSACR